MLFGIELLAAREREPEPQVRGLDVAMNEAGAVQRREAGAGLEHDLPQLEERHRARLGVLFEVGAHQVLEHQEGHGAGDPAVDDVRDVRVVEPCERVRLFDERLENAGPLGFARVDERLGLGDLEHEVAIGPRLSHEPDAPDASLAERSNELVALDELRVVLLRPRRRRG